MTTHLPHIEVVDACDFVTLRLKESSMQIFFIASCFTQLDVEVLS